jgi:hypothetical protein
MKLRLPNVGKKPRFHGIRILHACPYRRNCS